MNAPGVKERVYGAEHRLRELIEDMNDIWRRSLDELAPESPLDLYAVDSDVVYMFMAPEKSHSYGALLRYDGAARHLDDAELKDLETKLVAFLGNIIFFELRPDCPAILMADHAVELEKILNETGDSAVKALQTWDAVTTQLKKSAQGIIDVSRDRLEDAVVMVEGSKLNNQDIGPDINALLNEIYTSMRGDGAIGKLFRFDLLASSDRLKHLDRLQLQNEDGTPAALPSPLAADGKYIAPVARLASRLLQRMAQLDTIHSPARKLTMKGDAVVLAHLAWLNEHLASEQYYLPTSSGRRRVGKLLLITGSQLLPRAIKDLRLPDLQRCVFSPLSFLGHRLMDEYVQSSNAEAGPADIHAAGVKSSSLINFLDSMRQTLAEAIRQNNYDKIGHALVTVRSEHARLIDSWQGRQLFGVNHRPDGIAVAISELQEGGVTLAGLEGFMQKLSVSAWQAFARSVTLLGFKRVGKSGIVQRNIPPLRLTSYPHAQDLVTQLYRYAYNSGAGTETESPLNRTAILAVTAEDKSHYAEFLCYALWGLGHRLLRSAQGCAEMALSIVEESDDPERMRSERVEALYIRAHIIKLRAETPDDLNRAQQSMEQAVNSLASYPGGPDQRLTSEMFSIACHHCYFDVFGTNDRHAHPAPKRDEHSLRLTYERGRLLFKEVSEASNDRTSYSNEYVRQQLLVNLVQLALLCKFGLHVNEEGGVAVFVPIDWNAQGGEIERDFAEAAEQLIAQYQYLSRNESGVLPRPSVLSASVAAVAGAVWLGRNDLSAWLQPDTGRWAAIDDRRFKFLESVMRYCQR
jgi:hypothetical protein